MGDAELKQPFEGQFSDLDSESQADQGIREQVLNRLIVGQTIAVTFLTVMTASGGLLALLPLGGLAVIVGALSFWLLRRGQFRLGGYLFLVGTSAAITVNVFVRGYDDASAIYYLWPILGAMMLLDAMGGAIVATISATSYLALVVVQRLGYQVPPLPYNHQEEVLLTVGSRVMMFFLLAFLAWLSSSNLNRALQRARQAIQNWQEVGKTQELRVAERTRELRETTADLSFRGQELERANAHLTEARQRQEAINRELQAASERTRRRAAHLQAVAEVSRTMARFRDLERLLPQVTHLISQHFGFYHVGIFLVDEAGRYAVLRAANSEGGGRMLARNHKLAVGKQGIVGYVVAAGEPRVALSARDDSVHLVNPDLPSTLSEMALPLRIGGQTVGVLDVQSVEAEVFDREDVTVLSALADQVSIAIETARLFEQSREALAEAEETQRRYLGQEWQGFLQQRPATQFEYRLEGVPSALDAELPTAQQAMTRGELVAVSELAAEGDGDAVAQAVLSVPIKLRGQVIGVIDLHEADEARAWTQHEIALAQAVADQMAQAVETVRLSEQTQARARREQLVSRITSRMRAAPGVQDILRVAVEELGTVLGVTRSGVRLRPEETAAQAAEEALS